MFFRLFLAIAVLAPILMLIKYGLLVIPQGKNLAGREDRGPLLFVLAELPLFLSVGLLQDMGVALSLRALLWAAVTIVDVAVHFGWSRTMGLSTVRVIALGLTTSVVLGLILVLVPSIKG